MCERAHTHLPRQRPDATPPSPSLSLPLSTHTVVHSNLNVTTFRSPAIRYHLLLCSSASVLLQGEEGPSERKEGTWASLAPSSSFFRGGGGRSRGVVSCWRGGSPRTKGIITGSWMILDGPGIRYRCPCARSA